MTEYDLTVTGGAMFRFKKVTAFFLSVGFWIIPILSTSPVAVFASEKPEIFVQMGHIKRVNSVAFSSDGKYALTGSWDNTLKLWDIASGREVRTFYGTEKVTSIAISPNGKHVISGDEDEGKNLKLWDMASGKRIRTFSGDWEIIGMQDTENVVFSPDGKYVLSGGKNLNLWDTASGKKLRTFRNDNKDNARIISIVISPDGKHVITGSNGTMANAKSTDNTIRIWDIVTGRQIKAFNKGKGWVNAIAISPDGKHVISGDFEDSARMWDIATGRQMKAFNVKGVASIAISPDGKYALFGGSMDVRLWDIAKDREIRTFSGHRGWVRSVAFSPDGKYALSGSDDKAPKLWDIATGKELKSFGGYTQQVASVSVSSVGKTMLIGQEAGLLNLWDISTGRQIQTIKHTLGVRAAIISRDGTLAAAGGWDFPERSSTIKLWNIATGREIQTLRKAGKGQWSHPLAISPDNKSILWSVGSALMLSDIATGNEMKTYLGHKNHEIKNAMMSADGRYAISNDVLALNIWDVSTGKAIKTFHDKKGGLKGTLSSNGKYVLLMNYDDENKPIFKIWDIPTNREISKSAVQYGAHTPTGWIDSLTLSHDGRFALWSENTTLYLCEISTGKVIRTFSGHMNRISSIGISPDGKYVYSGSYDGTTRLWDINTGKEIAQFISFTDGEWIVITPEGYYNASANGDKHLNVRIGNNVYGIENYREAFFRPDLVKVALSGGSLKDFKTLADVKQPPVVEIVNTPSNINKDEVSVNIKLVDSGGGIGDVRLYLNGSAVILDSARGVKIVPTSKNEVVKTYKLKLSNGANIIKAIAFNAENTMQSKDAIHEIMASFKSSSKPSLYAVVIGINEYKNPKLYLKYAVPDASLFSDTLKKSASEIFGKVNIKLLSTKQETTNENIIKELKAMRSLNPDDLFVFYVASHGTVDEGEYFMITSNVGSTRTEKLKTDAISQTTLKELVANIPATKKLIIIDTCNAGALGDALQVAMLTRGMSEDTAMKILSRAVGSTILSASTSLQEAVEGYQGHGLFTYVLVEGLKGKADKGKTGYVKTTELADYVDNEVPVLAEKVFKKAQYPTISISGQAFPIGKTNR